MKLNPGQQYDVLNTITQLIIPAKQRKDVNARVIHDHYQRLSKQNKDKLWVDVSRLSGFPKEAIERYYFFTFCKSLYNGDLHQVKPFIDDIISSIKIEQSTDLQSTLKNVYEQCKGEVNQHNVCPSSVNQYIHKQLRCKIQEITPQQSVVVKPMIVYTTTPQQERHVDDLQLNNKDFQNMVLALKKMFDKQQQ